MGSIRKRGVTVTPEGLAFIEQKMRELGIDSREALAEAARLNPEVIRKKLFSGKNVERSTVEAIAKALKVQPTELVELDRWHLPSKTAKSQASINIDWKQVCQDVLELRRKMLLTSHPLGAARRVQDVYVPLELIERQSKPRSEQELSPEKYSVREQEEKTKPISHAEFFDSVLKDQNPKSEGKRIAIIGEPGAGKTTLLQEISTKVDGIPIWIDLASLKRDDTLEGYLLHNWLKSSLSLIRRYAPEAVTNLLEPSTELKQAFTQLFEQNQVWLLLDGADEMSAELGLPLNWVAQQLRQPGWVAKAKVVLTSRLNLWSTDGDRLFEFKTYRNLDFEPKQVIEFIDKWFAQKPDAKEKLKEDLAKSSDRIKSLIRNPLLLTLLCITWKGVGDRLPETKAGLYQRLVHSHYEHQWKTKPEDFAQFLDEEEQDKLNQWLGELSKTALDGKDSHFQGGRFRFRKSTLTYFAKQTEQGSYFLKWALKLEWLHQIGLPSTDELDADEPVYAFLHPTFQEYFAAQSIPIFDFFLNHNNQEPNPFKEYNGKDCIYRIFEPQWREIILLWLGLPSEKISDQQKENLIASLVTFNSGCGNTFGYRGLLLAVAGLGEFKNCKSTLTVIALLRIIDCFFYLQEIEEPARAALYETDQATAVALLKIRALADEDEYVRCESAYLLGKLNPGNKIAIQVFKKLIESTQDEWKLIKYARKLLEINSNNELAINTIIELSRTAKDKQVKQLSIWNLGEAEYGNETVISFLIDSIANEKEIYGFYELLDELEKIGKHQPRVINFFIDLISNIQDEEIHYDIIYGFRGIAPNNEFAIKRLEELIQQSKDERVLLHAACCLNQIAKNSSLANCILNEFSHSAVNNSYK